MARHGVSIGHSRSISGTKRAYGPLAAKQGAEKAPRSRSGAESGPHLAWPDVGKTKEN